MFEWIREYAQFLDTLFLVSLGMFAASLLATPWIVAKLPADYFAFREAPAMGWQIEHPIGRSVWLVARNVFGAVLIVAGIEHSLRYGISYWDGAIVAAAEALGAPTLYSEDLSDGQRYGGVRVVDPFVR